MKKNEDDVLIVTFGSDVVAIQCFQYDLNNDKSPVLPPDNQECHQRGSTNRLKFDNIKEARDSYKNAMTLKSSKFTKRKYVRGGIHRNVFNDSSYFLDVRDYGGSVNLCIDLGDGMATIFKIRDLTMEIESMKEIKKFSEECNKDSKARQTSGDLGSMFAFGLHNRNVGDYISMKDMKMDITKYCQVSRKLLEKYFRSEVEEIISADRSQQIIPSNRLGGTDGISAYCLVSRDLINAAHYDLDTSKSITVFNEKIPGRAKNWFFILPNVVLKRIDQERAIVIQLFDGCTLCWDGRKVFHCTGTKEIGKDNHVYGSFWGGKFYR